jgi:hypothetical protein
MEKKPTEEKGRVEKRRDEKAWILGLIFTCINGKTDRKCITVKLFDRPFRKSRLEK